jgi:hypothetical protein
MASPPDSRDDDRRWRWSSFGPPGAPAQERRVPANADAAPAMHLPLGQTEEPPALADLKKPDRKKSNDGKAARKPAKPAAPEKLSPLIKPSGKAGELARQFIRCALSARQTAAVRALHDILRGTNVRFFSGGGASQEVHRVNVTMDSAQALVPALRKLRESFEFFLEPVGASILTIREFGDSWPQWPRSLRLLVVERSILAGGYNQVHCSVIEVALWSVAESYSSERSFQTDLPHRSFSRIREKTILKMLAAGEDSDAETGADVYACAFPIDIVYTWVNDQDKAWQQRKDRVSLRHNRPANAGMRAKLNERFRNRDELRYSFRSIEMFAPFVRKIFLVTDDQTPDWLDTRNPRVQVVSHRQIFRDRAWLPTFNSSGIETQLHHVNGLSEHFLYFNDDFFLGDIVQPEDFFLANGAVRSFPSDQFANEKDIDDEREEYVVADKNAIDLFKEDFNGFGRNIMLHVPYPSSKSLLQTMEARYQRHFDACARNPFRSLQDLRPIAFMQYHYGFRNRLVVPSRISHRYLALWKPQIQKQLDNVRTTRAFKTFCINDVGVPPEREQAVNDAVRSFLEAYFPFKSAFEK